MNKIRQNVFPLLAALIWGAAFSSQAICSDRGMGAFTFNMLRGFVAFLALLIIAVILPISGKMKMVMMSRRLSPCLI